MAATANMYLPKLTCNALYCCSFSKHLAFSRHLYLLDGRHLAAYKPLTGQQCRPDLLNCTLLTNCTYLAHHELESEKK